MNFDFSDEQFALRDNVRDFLEQEWGVSKLRAGGESGCLSMPFWQASAALGLPSMMVPVSSGGLGLDMLDAVLIFEAFGQTLVPRMLTETMIGAALMAREPDSVLNQALLSEIATGTARIAMAVADFGGGPASIDFGVQAHPTGDGYRLKGRKILVHYADDATHFVLTAQTSERDSALFLLPMRADGIQLRTHQINDPGSRACEVQFDLELPSCYRLQAQGASDWLIDALSLAATAEMMGAAERAMHLALDYVKLRKQFDQTIGSFQAIKHKFADMFTGLEAGRAALYHAAWSVAQDDALRARAVSTAKSFCAQACRVVCNESLQVHGGIGYTWAYDLHYFLKRIKALEYAFGDARWHRERVMASVLAGDSAGIPGARDLPTL